MKNLINYFINNLSPTEKQISIQDLSIFFSVLIASFSIYTLKHKRKIEINYLEYNTEFESEIKLIRQQYPELYQTFSKTVKRLTERLVIDIFEKLKDVFEKPDSDFDDIISWSYQFLKKDLEKSALERIGFNNNKIEGSDLLFTTQFFTDKYMVKYLVDKCFSEIEEQDVLNIVVVDCASGGGNFLTYSFEKFFVLYKKLCPNWSAQKIVDIILEKAIVGYDLDENLSNIASLSLYVKASSYAQPSLSTKIKIFGGLENDKYGYLSDKINSNRIGKTTFESLLSSFEKERKRKIFVANPPFMGKRDMDISLKDFILNTYPESKGDLCISFLQKMLQSMNGKDIIGIVVQNNWMYLSSFKSFRKVFLEKYKLKFCVDLGSNAFENINGEKTNVALCVINQSCNSDSIFYNLKNCDLKTKKELINNDTINSKLTFRLNQDLFCNNKNFEFYYQFALQFESIKNLSLYGAFANPMQGTSTGNNTDFVKFAWEVNGNPDWKLVSKGGGFSKWVGLNYYKVNWGKNAEKIKENKGSALRNIDKIPSTQLVYSDTGTLGLNVRVLKKDQVFIASGPGILVREGNVYAHLAFLNSRIATFLLKSLNPKFTISAGYISNIPVVPDILHSTFIADRGEKCFILKETYLKNKLPNIEFKHSDYLNIVDVNLFIEGSIISDLENDYERLELESEIEDEIKRYYRFSKNELVEIKSIVGESPVSNKHKGENIDINNWDLLLSKSIDINCLSTSRIINGYTNGSESILEDLSYKLNISPKKILDIITKNISNFILTKQKYYNDLIHKIILYEFGIETISKYQYQIVKLDVLVKNLVCKYSYLKNKNELKDLVTNILNIHHRASFYNKPLVVLANNKITVGNIE
ncbi:Eco57I restriction-modification methylase domain-containing protein [Bacteroides sp.]